MGAAIEGLMPDAGDAVRNGNALQAGTLPEGLLPDDGDRITFNGVGNHQFPRRRRFTKSDGDLPVSRGVSQVI